MDAARVLVIDDSPTIARVVQLVLTKAGYDVSSATDGEAGLAQARAQRPDLILLDFVMPRLNGYQVCRELAADPGLRDVPVVLLSAKGDQVGERFVKVMGIVDYITKPFAPEALTAVVQHTIAKYGGRHAAGGDTVPIDPVGGASADDAARAAVLAELRGQLADAIGARVAALFALAGAAEGDDVG
ncbi:MAG TPA: response regulator, partial [Kofleriaceae bacterium]|nr:response regulator [Kofleriaceae bacterium]